MSISVAIAEMQEKLDVIDQMQLLQDERGDISERRSIIDKVAKELIEELTEVRKNYG
jgi:hypothetical protein